MAGTSRAWQGACLSEQLRVLVYDGSGLDVIKVDEASAEKRVDHGGVQSHDRARDGEGVQVVACKTQAQLHWCMRPCVRHLYVCAGSGAGIAMCAEAEVAGL
jgi:hypothetical protein